MSSGIAVFLVHFRASFVVPEHGLPASGVPDRDGRRGEACTGCSLLLLAGDDLGLGGTLDLLPLALELLGHLSGSLCGAFANFVLLKYIS